MIHLGCNDHYYTQYISETSFLYGIINLWYKETPSGFSFRTTSNVLSIFFL